MSTAIVLLNESGRWLVTQLRSLNLDFFFLAGIVLVVLRVKSPVLLHLFWRPFLGKRVVGKTACDDTRIMEG